MGAGERERERERCGRRDSNPRSCDAVPLESTPFDRSGTPTLRDRERERERERERGGDAARRI